MRRLEAESRVSSVTFAMANPGDEANARIEAEGVSPSRRNRKWRRAALPSDRKQKSTRCGLTAWMSTSSAPSRFRSWRAEGSNRQISPPPAPGPAKMGSRPKAERSWSTCRSPKRFSAATPSAGASAMSIGAEARGARCGVRGLVRDRRYRHRFPHRRKPRNARHRAAQGVPRGRGRPGAARGHRDSDARRRYPLPSPNACGRSRQRSIPTSICAIYAVWTRSCAASNGSAA